MSKLEQKEKELQMQKVEKRQQKNRSNIVNVGRSNQRPATENGGIDPIKKPVSSSV